MSDNKEKKQEVKGFIFYPREYHIVEGDIYRSYAIGLSEGGKECLAFIHPEEHHVEAARNYPDKRIPSFEDFYESEPPCEAYADNGPDNPRSMILLEQATPGAVEGISDSRPIMIAKWASIIKLNDRAIKPPVGYGYLEINLNGARNEETQYQLNQVREIQQQIDAGSGDILALESERDRMISDIYLNASCFFSVVMLAYNQITQVNDREHLQAILSKCYEKFTHDGRFAGALVRVRDASNVYLDKCSTYEVRYDSKAGAVEGFAESFDRFMKFGGNQSLNASRQSGYILEVIPAQRLNCGPMGNGRYQKDLALAQNSKMMKTYVERDFYCKPYINLKREKAFLYSRIALRIAKAKKGVGKGNHLVSSIHAYMKPRGNPFQIDDKAKPVYKGVRG